MNLNKALAEAIAKGASGVTRKPVAALRRDVADLKRQVVELKRALKGLQRQAGAAPTPAADEGDAPSMRPTAKMIRGLRKNLGLTQTQLGKLAGVSALTVSKWEASTGRIRMRGRALAGLAKVRAMGKREAKQMIGGQQ